MEELIILFRRSILLIESMRALFSQTSTLICLYFHKILPTSRNSGGFWWKIIHLSRPSLRPSLSWTCSSGSSIAAPFSAANAGCYRQYTCQQIQIDCSCRSPGRWLWKPAGKEVWTSSKGDKSEWWWCSPWSCSSVPHWTTYFCRMTPEESISRAHHPWTARFWFSSPHSYSRCRCW